MKTIDKEKQDEETVIRKAYANLKINEFKQKLSEQLDAWIEENKELLKRYDEQGYDENFERGHIRAYLKVKSLIEKME